MQHTAAWPQRNKQAHMQPSVNQCILQCELVESLLHAAYAATIQLLHNLTPVGLLMAACVHVAWLLLVLALVLRAEQVDAFSPLFVSTLGLPGETGGRDVAGATRHECGIWVAAGVEQEQDASAYGAALYISAGVGMRLQVTLSVEDFRQNLDKRELVNMPEDPAEAPKEWARQQVSGAAAPCWLLLVAAAAHQSTWPLCPSCCSYPANRPLHILTGVGVEQAVLFGCGQ